MTAPAPIAGLARTLGPLHGGALAAFVLGAVLVTGLSLVFGGGPGMVLGVGLYGVAAFGLQAAYPHHAFGLCNTITLVRLALIASLTALLVAPAPPSEPLIWAAFGVAILSLALDGVDGWAARRAGLVSGFGARFDMEVDSVFALVLALLAFGLGHAGPWVILLGLPRYAFLVAGQVWPWLRESVPDRFSRKAVCVLQIGVLVLLLMPVTPDAVGIALGLVAVAAVTWSFARDIRLLRARRA